jgi:hypothetical protein
MPFRALDDSSILLRWYQVGNYLRRKVGWWLHKRPRTHGCDNCNDARAYLWNVPFAGQLESFQFDTKLSSTNGVGGCQGTVLKLRMTKKKRDAPYGEWESDISAEAVTAGTRSITSVRVCVSTPCVEHKISCEPSNIELIFIAED